MKKAMVILLHLGYWGCYTILLLLFYTLVSTMSGPKDVGVHFAKLMIGTAVIPSMVTFYGAYFFLFKKYLQPKNFLGLILRSLLFIVAGTIAGELFLNVAFEWGFLFRGGWNSAVGATIIILVIAALNIVLGLIIKGFVEWYDDIKVKQELKDKNHQIEMALVKARLEPHFLFNTLNNIDVLIQKDQEAASNYLNQLSQLMRYMLYDAKSDSVPLQKELDYLTQYINLQKIRTANPNFVEYTIQTSSKKVNIAPMLFIPFIENAFKHATNKKAEQAIKILLLEDGNQIKFVCENDISQTANTPSETGIGNELIKKRLDLLYPDHQLDISNANGVYKVQLTIQPHDI